MGVILFRFVVKLLSPTVAIFAIFVFNPARVIIEEIRERVAREFKVFVFCYGFHDSCFRVQASVVHVARFKEPGTVEAGVLALAKIGQVLRNLRNRLASFFAVEFRVAVDADNLRQLDEVFFAHYKNKWPALGCNRVITE